MLNTIEEKSKLENLEDTVLTPVNEKASFVTQGRGGWKFEGVNYPLYK